MFEQLNPEIIRQQQLAEIEEVKNRMAKYKVNVPIKKLMDSMMVPSGGTKDKYDLLPEPGQGLMVNPFFKGKKKKKGKGKKKKKAWFACSVNLWGAAGLLIYTYI